MIRHTVGVLPLVLLLSAGSAQAAAYEPVLDPEAGPLRLSLGYGAAQLPERDLECGDRDHCTGWWRRTALAVEGEAILLRGLALFGEVGQSSDRLGEANYRGTGLGWGGGLRLSAPLGQGGWTLGAQGRLSWSWGEGGSLDTGGVESSWAHVHDLTAVLAWGSPVDGLSAWVGGQTAWHWRHQVQPLGYADGEAVLDLRMVPRTFGSVVAGASVTSQGLGTDWSRSARLSTGLSLSYGQRQGFHAWVATRY